MLLLIQFFNSSTYITSPSSLPDTNTLCTLPADVTKLQTPAQFNTSLPSLHILKLLLTLIKILLESELILELDPSSRTQVRTLRTREACSPKRRNSHVWLSGGCARRRASMSRDWQLTTHTTTHRSALEDSSPLLELGLKMANCARDCRFNVSSVGTLVLPSATAHLSLLPNFFK
jgi:hypothetical protein